MDRLFRTICTGKWVIQMKIMVSLPREKRKGDSQENDLLPVIKLHGRIEAVFSDPCHLSQWFSNFSMQQDIWRAILIDFLAPLLELFT